MDVIEKNRAGDMDSGRVKAVDEGSRWSVQNGITLNRVRLLDERDMHVIRVASINKQ